jgi:hypothetical protein
MGSPARTTPTRDNQVIEQAIYSQNTAFVKRLHQLRIPVTVDAYSPGTHDWRYWQRELHRSLPLLLGALQQHWSANLSPGSMKRTTGPADARREGVSVIPLVIPPAATPHDRAVSAGRRIRPEQRRPHQARRCGRPRVDF